MIAISLSSTQLFRYQEKLSNASDIAEFDCVVSLEPLEPSQSLTLYYCISKQFFKLLKTHSVLGAKDTAESGHHLFCE